MMQVGYWNQRNRIGLDIYQSFTVCFPVLLSSFQIEVYGIKLQVLLIRKCIIAHTTDARSRVCSPDHAVASAL